MSDDFKKWVEDFQKWLWNRLTWEWFFLGAIGTALLITYLITGKLPWEFTQRQSSQSLPEFCYCWDCGYVIDMKKHGLYGKHCKEIRCPRCGSTNVWRRPKK